MTDARLVFWIIEVTSWAIALWLIYEAARERPRAWLVIFLTIGFLGISVLGIFSAAGEIP